MLKNSSIKLIKHITIMNRIFLSWNEPACQLIAKRLITQENGGYQHLVLVPTKDSGRQLREQLAVQSANKAVFSPKIQTVDQFSMTCRPDNSATSMEVLTAGYLALKDNPHQHYPTLFPTETQTDTPSLLTIAKKLNTLRTTLTSQMSSCQKIADKQLSHADTRWEDLANFSRECTQILQSWGVSDPCIMDEQAIPNALLHSLKEQGGKIIVACVTDISPALVYLLNRAEDAGINIELWIHAPEDKEHTFDSWGRPNEYWNTCNIPIKNENITVCSTQFKLAQQVCKTIANVCGKTTDIALGICDTDANILVDHALEEHNWGLHILDGRPFSATGIMDVMQGLELSLREIGNARSLMHLTKCTTLFQTLDIKANQHSCCVALDGISQIYLPSSEEYLLSCIEKSNNTDLKQAVSQIKEWRDKVLRPKHFVNELILWCKSLEKFANPEVITKFRKALEELSSVQTKSEKFRSTELAIHILLQTLQSQRISEERAKNAVLDSLGWMELPYRPESNLIITGLIEGIVPEGKVDDPFLPEQLKKELHLYTSLNKIQARDSFLLTSLIESRKTIGGVQVIISRLNTSNEPLTPSSLLMQCSDEELPQRVQNLFAETSEEYTPITNDKETWKLTPLTGDWNRESTKVEEFIPNFKNPWANGEKTFSPSKLRDFLECPKSFWIKTAMGLYDNPLEYDKEAMVANETGTFIHEILQEFCATYCSKDKITSESDMIADINKRIETKFTEKFGAPPLLMPLHLQKLDIKRRLETFVPLHINELNDGWSCIEFEKQIDGWRLGGFPIKMVIDRIDRHENGRIRVIDYKTGNVEDCRKAHVEGIPEEKVNNLKLLSENLQTIPKKGNSNPGRWKNLQLPMYVLWAKETFADPTPETAYICLNKNPEKIKLIPWDNLHSEVILKKATKKSEENQTRPSDMYYAEMWLLEVMRLITNGEGCISAEDLGWKVPEYSVFKKLVNEGESLNTLF